MRTPPFLLGAGLLFWGWQTSLWPFAIAIALLLEASRWAPWRLQLTVKEFRRIWDVSALSFTATLIYLWNTDEVAVAVLSVVQWLPIFMFPIVAAQAYAEESRINRTTFFWLLRRYSPPEALNEKLDVSYAYLGVCLLATSAANVRDSRFYIGLCVLLGIALWANRSRRVFAPITIGLLALAVVLGSAVASTIRNLQAQFEHRTAEWLSTWAPRDLDDIEGITRIGGVAPMKLSGQVVLRIQGEIPAHPPELLRQLTFTRYEAGSWYAFRREYETVLEEGVASWTLARERQVRRSAIINIALPRRRAFLPAPLGTARLSELPAKTLECNRLGTIRVDNTPEILDYRVHYGPGAGADRAPNRYDFEVPRVEAALITRIVSELKLQDQTPEQVLNALKVWFQQKFEYSLEGVSPRYSLGKQNESRLSHFLTEARRGHCEYFATAATLMLRAAGIPARYATGFSVQEPSPSGKNYIVRQRHAHAWVLVHINGRWIDFDPTPSSWDEQENEQASFWRPVSDWWSDFRFFYALWQWEDKTGLPKQYLFAPLFLLGTLLTWRLVTRTGRKASFDGSRSNKSSTNLPGLDSDFYRIEQHLRKKGLGRQPTETQISWARRIKAEGLEALIALHYRYRFDPASLPPQERTHLTTSVRDWLTKATSP